MIQIRLLNENDCEQWKQLRLLALKSVPDAFCSSYEEESTWSSQDFINILKNNTIFGAFIDDQLIGSAAMGVMRGLKRKHQGVVWGVFVKPEYRGQKIGDMLLKAVITHAKNIVSQLQISAHTENHSALHLYQQNGFKTYGTEPRGIRIDNRYYDECLMMLIFN